MPVEVGVFDATRNVLSIGQGQGDKVSRRRRGESDPPPTTCYKEDAVRENIKTDKNMAVSHLFECKICGRNREPTRAMGQQEQVRGADRYFRTFL